MKPLPDEGRLRAALDELRTRRFLTSNAMRAGVPLPPMTTWKPASVQEAD
jgi:hypothetical protein